MGRADTPPSGLVTSFTSNRISGGSYDADGNLLTDPLLPSQANAFDAEGHEVTLEGVNVVYDALGPAVEASGQEFLYAPDGRKIAGMNGQSLQRADIPLPGGDEAVYNASGLQWYRHADRLGSGVLTTNTSGGVLSSTEYTPFGFDDTGTGAGYRSFTGQKQDIDSSHSGGQYDFLLREYNPIQGRWWTPDPAGLAAVDPNNPQTWNRYAYVGGTPLEATDPLGLHAQACTTDNCSWDDPVGCTLDGMSIGCDMVQRWADMGGGGGAFGGDGGNDGAPIFACNGCPSSGIFYSPVNGEPYRLTYWGEDGMAWTAENGEEVSWADTGSRELDLPDLTTNPYPFQPLVLQPSGPPQVSFRPPPPGTPKFQAPAPPTTQVYPRSYASFLACEYGVVMGDPHQVGVILAVNLAPFVVWATGNVPRAFWALGMTGAYDIAGAWAVRSACSVAVYGPQ
ncbi:MAG: RHS repeat-associated core domain-containing protein [Terriglobales bacterium]